MSQKLISRSPDLAHLREQGFNLGIRAGYLLVDDVPYVNSKKEIRRGMLVAKLILAGDVTSQPENHVVHFIGEYPCDADGKPIEQIRNNSGRKELVSGLFVDHTFSAKPKPAGNYKDYHEEITTYCSILGGPARKIDPSVSAKTFVPVPPDDDDNSPFNYIDTASSRAEIDLITAKLALERIAIIGVGGTGAYVLDLIAKTPVREIHLYDKDELLTHNAFRAPGAPSLEELRTKPKKVTYLKAIYSKMHRGIVAHPEQTDASNIEQLRNMNFVFLCLDDGAAKGFIIEKLEEYGISFVDVGMGLHVGDTGLGGTVRITASTPQQRQHVRDRIPLAGANGQNEYSNNIQIADLNALNAALAVIKWKKLFGFYMDFENEHHSTYGIEVQLLTRGDKPE